jgi:tetratricopeptide (TPR) repeat protein
VGLFVLALLGGISAVILFRNVLLPAQQQRVIDQLPFMRQFMAPTPEGGTLPTPLPNEGDISPEQLLAAPLVRPTITLTPTEAATEVPTATESIEVAASPTTAPTDSASPTPTATEPPPTLVPASQSNTSSQIGVQTVSLPASARMYGFTQLKQTWNNCGPANLTQALSYYGWTHDQSFAASYLKPNREDKNVNPWELVQFVNEQTQLRAVTRMGGDLNLLKAFIAAQIPIIIETGYMPEGYDWIGHYQTIVAYDDLQKDVYIYDTYLGSGDSGEGLAESYDSFNENWKHFNRTFIVIYEPNRENEVRQILGDRADPQQAAQYALQMAKEDLQANPRDVFAWFNEGTSYTKLGEYEEAASAYDQARREGALPWRMIWYQFGPFEAYFNTGRYDEVMALVNINLTNGAQYVEETYYWQGRVLEAEGNIAGARSAFQQALSHNSRYADARDALSALNA